MKKLIPLLAFLALPVLADDEKFIVATGSAAGTYNTQLTQLKNVCGDYLPNMEALGTNGSVDNIEKLANNEVNAAFVQTDVLFWYDATIKKLSNIKTIYALHPEALHFVAPVQSKIERKSYGGLKKTAVEFGDVNDLAGYAVGVVEGSGSAVTAEFLAAKAGINYELRKYPSGKDLKPALDRGEVAAILLVGGQPLGDVVALGPDYKLLAVPQNVADRVSKYYDPAKLSYSKMGARGVPTVATQANLVSRTYKDKDVLAALGALRQCLDDKLGKLQDMRGAHPSWGSVQDNADEKNRGRWTWYELPSSKAAEPPPPVKTPVATKKSKRS